MFSDIVAIGSIDMTILKFIVKKRDMFIDKEYQTLDETREEVRAIFVL